MTRRKLKQYFMVQEIVTDFKGEEVKRESRNQLLTFITLVILHHYSLGSRTDHETHMKRSKKVVKLRQKPRERERETGDRIHEEIDKN